MFNPRYKLEMPSWLRVHFNNWHTVITKYMYKKKKNGIIYLHNVLTKLDNWKQIVLNNIFLLLFTRCYLQLLKQSIKLSTI